jgi:hypothetical protein
MPLRLETMLQRTLPLPGLAIIATSAMLWSGEHTALAADGASQARSTLTASGPTHVSREQTRSGPFIEFRKGIRDIQHFRAEQLYPPFGLEKGGFSESVRRAKPEG